MRRLARASVITGTITWMAALAACGGGVTQPQVPQIPPTIGAYCGSTTPVVTASNGSTLVTLYLNTTTYRDVRRSDGVIISQQVLGCRMLTCSYQTTTISAADAISYCTQYAQAHPDRQGF